MKKKDKLYTVNKYNKNLLCGGGHKFAGGGKTIQDLASEYYDKHPELYDPSVDMIDAYKNTKNVLGITKANNPFSKINIGNTLGSIGSAAASAIAPSIGGWISNGYSTNGVGEMIGNVGGEALGAVGGAMFGPLGQAAGKVVGEGLGGVYNLAFGTKWDEKLLKDIQDNLRVGRAAGKALASSTNNSEVLDSAGQMTSGMNFSYKDLGSTGFLKGNGKLKRKQKKLAGAQNSALAYQQQGLMTGINNADYNMDNTAFVNTVAFGGPLDSLTNSEMGAISYDLLSDYILNGQRKAAAQNKIAGVSTPNLFAEGGPKGNKWVTPVGTVSAGGFVPNNTRGSYGGGRGSGGGAGTKGWDLPEYDTTVQKDTLFVPIETTFNDAFANARRKGLDTFEFNGRTYTTEMSDNPGWREAGDARKEIDLVPLTFERKKTTRKKSDGGTLFALGGDIQNHGADWTLGSSHINAGGSHEENPNEGVQVGVDSQGVPNLVEENEVIFNDYVYSARIEADDQTKEAFHISKKRKITYADLAKKLEKESLERPNDPISKAAFKANMEDLANEQERQKAEMQAEEAKKAFEALSPEEQVAVMQQMQAEEQAAQEAAMQEQAMAQQQAVEQGAIPEEAVMGQQDIPVQDPYAQQQALVSADGGVLTRVSDGYKNPHKFKKGGRTARKTAERYNNDWFLRQGKNLGMIDPEATEIEGFKFNPYDPQENIDIFNYLYKAYQKKQALDTYIKGQRQAKQNALLDSKLYTYSDDKSKLYKTRVNDAVRNGWISSDYTGAMDENGNYIGFLSPEEYSKLSDDDKERYKRINEQEGDFMRDYSGNLIKDLQEDVTLDDILDKYSEEYKKGFKWNDQDAQVLGYPAVMRHSPLSYARYAPIVGNALGLAYNIFKKPDYSRAQELKDYALNFTPSLVSANYNPTYLGYRPMDVWANQNRMNANARAVDRAIRNGVSPSADAALLANAYNNQIASSELYRNALEYNDNLRSRVATHNAAENKTLAQLNLQADMANQNAINSGRYYGLMGLQTANSMMDNIDANRNAAINANLTGLIQSIGNVGEEADDMDRLRWLEDTGVLKSDYFNRYAAKGGKIKRKKGGK